MAEASASIIVEVLLTLFALYFFFVVGVLLLLGVGISFHEHSRLLVAVVLTLPVPVVMAGLLRYGSLFERMHGFLLGPVGTSPLSEGAASLDREIRAILSRHREQIPGEHQAQHCDDEYAEFHKSVMGLAHDFGLT